MIRIQVINYDELERLAIKERVEKILKIVMKGVVVVINGRLTIDEKNELYKENLKNISKNLSFHGIEIAELMPGSQESWWNKLKATLASLFIGRKLGITLIGPADLIKEIKQDINKVEILAGELKQ